MQMLVHIGLLYFAEKNEIVLVLNMFLKKSKNLLKNSLDIKTWKQTLSEYKETIQ